MAKVITVVNQKGGVGKTTISCHLAFRAVEAGLSVLVVDFDTQGSASTLLTGDFDIAERRGGAEQLFSPGEMTYTDGLVPGIKVLHGHEHLEELDNRSDQLLAMAAKMRTKIRQLPFDLVIFDTPPGISPRHAAPLFWANLAVIAAEPSMLSMVGVKGTFRAIKGAMRINPGMQHRIVVNRFNRSAGNQKQIREDLSQKYGDIIIGEFGGRSAVQSALETCKPVWLVAKDRKLRAEWKTFADRTLAIVA